MIIGSFPRISKIKELQDNNADILSKCDEKLLIQKQEYYQQLKDVMEKQKQERVQSEQKYEQKRKALKEAEANLAKQSMVLEKEKAVIQEKYANLEAKKGESEKQHKEAIAALETEIAQLKETLSKGNSGILQENEKLKSQAAELEKKWQKFNQAAKLKKSFPTGKSSSWNNKKRQLEAKLQKQRRVAQLQLINCKNVVLQRKKTRNCQEPAISSNGATI